MKLSDGLFPHSIRAVATEYPEHRIREISSINPVCTVMNPAQFDCCSAKPLRDVVSRSRADWWGAWCLSRANIGDDVAVRGRHGTRRISSEKESQSDGNRMSGAMMLN